VLSLTMNEYLHMSPNFGKHKLIPILLLLPLIGFFVVVISSQRELTSSQVDAYATTQPEEIKILKIKNVSIPVEIADTNQKRSSGLSNRPPLKENAGMLFIFPSKQNIDTINPFWMKEMYFDIDIIWINEGKIVEITEKVPPPQNPNEDPNKLPIYYPDGPYEYVLEMNAGSAEKMGFQIGDEVTIPTL